MTIEFPFPHHNYQNALDAGDFEFISSDLASGMEDLRAEELKDTARVIQAANVTHVMLIHGTFAGDDVLGLMRELARVLPGPAASLQSLGKRLVDQVAGEIGNYSQAFAEQLAEVLNRGSERELEVSRFSWSGENHHLGRAGGALALLDQLLSTSWQPHQRLMIWAHSHGGNLLALLSNLIGCSNVAVEQFFAATQSHYLNPMLGRLDLPLWDRVKRELLKGNVQRRLPALDFITFGTPPRYRWNPDFCGKLVHFVQHRSLDSGCPVRALLPTSISQLAAATGGDYVQQLGIGGTDFLHSVLAWRSWNSERRLRRMLEAEVRRRDLPRNLQKGHRVSLDGKTLLVDYPDEPSKWNQVLLGHGIYTRPEWIPFHLRQIAQRVYA